MVLDQVAVVKYAEHQSQKCALFVRMEEMHWN